MNQSKKAKNRRKTQRLQREADLRKQLSLTDKSLESRHQYFKSGVMKLKRSVIKDTGLNALKYPEHRKVNNPAYQTSFKIDKVNFKVIQKGNDWLRLGANLTRLSHQEKGFNFIKRIIG